MEGKGSVYPTVTDIRQSTSSNQSTLQIDRKFEKQFEEKRGNLRRLQQQNEILRAHQRTFIDGCNALESCAVMLQMRLEQELNAPEFNFHSSHDYYFPHS
ncbi:hypothetical protein Y032_0058g2873 [Ancylostoma ceylanicum]|uniref:Uncharacterized protein n=1 Tax=Ancylostoma ceylanicum TaxID=53326 RepID=A0A016U4W6_9BILA|nr:hypothetical protein Y032_0058g2873 [Ancylostoma ceylanicum]